ncbi:MAG: FAD-linked oxidase C-terminal domain-containing protein, partial [Bacteroidota bacterium]
EMVWNNFYRLATSPPSQMKPPISQEYKYYVLVECLGSNQQADSLKLQTLMEEAFERDMILDAVFADTQSDLEWLWKIREDVHAAVSQLPNDQHFDISLPIPEIGRVVDQILTELQAIEEVTGVVGFGHVADGNIHLVVGKSEQNDQLIHRINQVVYDPLQDLGGSISAEHGIGRHKKAYLHLCRSDEEIQLMQLVKKSLDPNRILNPGKVIN